MKLIELSFSEMENTNGGNEFSDYVLNKLGNLFGSYAVALSDLHDDGVPYTQALGRGI